MIPIIEVFEIKLAAECGGGPYHMLELSGDQFYVLYSDRVLSDDPSENIIFRSSDREVTMTRVQVQGIDRRFEDNEEIVRTFITGHVRLPTDLKVWNESH
jgi:hypothetical protein